jgi:Raf kinase inhibitor-like YbhB/YbcL family protein
MSLTLEVASFPHEGQIPKKFTCEGENLSPAIHWAGVPSSTRSLALILDDPDAPAGVWTHWLLWDIPARVSSLPEGYHPRSPVHTGTNDFGKPGYGGPCPPKGHGPHRYFLRLYALGVEALDVSDRARRAELERALRPHILATVEYFGTFERK